MDNQAHTSYLVQDRSYFSIYKKEIHKLVLEDGFSPKRIGEIDIIVAEIMSNLLKHTPGGELLVKLTGEGESSVLELISIDSGPGMAEPLKMMADGVSTTNTLGQGLGAIKRLSDNFQLYSLKDWGTILLSRVYKNPPTGYVKEPPTQLRAIVVPKPGETLSGDGFYHKITGDHWKVFLGDGLGHGEEAHKAMNLAITAFRAEASNDPVEIIKAMHIFTKRSRGLVGTVAVYSFVDKTWQVCGVGNISTTFLNSAVPKAYMGYNGVIGMNLPGSMKSQTITPAHNQTLVLCSDGIRTRFDIQKYPLISKYDLSILAAAIYKDLARKTDDMSVVLSKVN